MQTNFVFREAAKGLGRNITMTIALIITTAVSVGLVVAGVLVTILTQDTKDIYLEQVEVMVQLDEEISANDTDCTSAGCKEIKDQLESDSGVEKVTFRSQEESYERFKQYFQETDPLLVEETSPDALPAALHVRLVDPADTAAIDAIRGLPQIDAVVDQVEEVDRATDNLDSIRNATFLVAAVQAVAAIFLITNMVQIAAYNRSTEMSIMRMVGASRWITQAPFVLEAVLSTLIGVVVAGIGLFLTKSYVVDPSLQSLYQAQLLAPLHTKDIWIALPIVGVVAMAFAALAAQVTLRLYVKK